MVAFGTVRGICGDVIRCVVFRPLQTTPDVVSCSGWLGDADSDPGDLSTADKSEALPDGRGAALSAGGRYPQQPHMYGRPGGPPGQCPVHRMPREGGGA